MNRPVSQIRCGNRIIQQKQDLLSLEKHYQSLRKARPMTGVSTDKNTVTINNKKRQMVIENRFTQIERQNRILFQKITTIMHKGTISHPTAPIDKPHPNNNKTLNGFYRKKQMQNIEYENAKMLKRLKQKKSSYGVQQLHKDWIKKKKVIQNMSLYPFILNDNLGNQFKRSKHNEINLNDNYQSEEIKRRQMRRMRKINGFMFLITVKFQQNRLFIIGDNKEQNNIKVIELEKNEADEFISEQCNGNIENIFSLLRYDEQSGDLFLVGKQIGQIEQVRELQNDRGRMMSQQNKRIKITSLYEPRGKKTTLNKIRQNPPRPLSKQLPRKNRIAQSYRQNNLQDLSIANVNTHLKMNRALTQQQQSPQHINLVQNYLTLNQSSNVVNDQLQSQMVNQNQNKQSQWVKIQTLINQTQNIITQNDQNQHKMTNQKQHNMTDQNQINPSSQYQDNQKDQYQDNPSDQNQNNLIANTQHDNQFIQTQQPPHQQHLQNDQNDAQSLERQENKQDQQNDQNQQLEVIQQL